MKLVRLCPAVVAVVLSALPSLARAYTSSGQLVYHFTYSANQDISARDSSDSAESYGVNPNPPKGSSNGPGITGGSNGISHYGGTLTDKGTITVDIVKKQPDGAMVRVVDRALVAPGEVEAGRDDHLGLQPAERGRQVAPQRYPVFHQPVRMVEELDLGHPHHRGAATADTHYPHRFCNGCRSGR